jgi:hypothetical protein
VDVLRAGKHYERLCGDLLAVHQRKCTLGKMETSSRLASDEITNGHERHGPFTQLVGYGWFGSGRVLGFGWLQG